MLNSISETMFGHVVRCTTSFKVWPTLELLFTTQLKARTLQICFQFQSLKKENMFIRDYMLKMTSLAENLSTAGQIILDEELILYILGDLGHDYDLIVITLTSRPDTITLHEIQFLLQSQEMHLEQLTLLLLVTLFLLVQILQHILTSLLPLEVTLVLMETKVEATLPVVVVVDVEADEVIPFVNSIIELVMLFQNASIVSTSTFKLQVLV